MRRRSFAVAGSIRLLVVACSLARTTTTLSPSNDDGDDSSNVTLIPPPFPTPPTVVAPPGCACRSPSCEAFDCVCPCDATAHACDLDCCCDPDCDAGERARFRADGVCDADDDPVVRTCRPTTSALEEAHPRFPMRVRDSVEDAMNGLLCVETTNDPSRGRFLTDPGYVASSSSLSLSLSRRRGFDYDSYRRTVLDDRRSAGSPSNFFRRGDTLPVFLRGGGERFSLRLPVPTNGENCDDSHAVRFGVDTVGNTCFRLLADLPRQCEHGALNVRRLTADLYVGSKANVATIVASGEEENNDLLLPITLLGNDAPPSTRWDADSSTCRDALQRLAYEITYDNEGHLVRVTADARTIDVPAPSAAGIYQEFSVRFRRASKDDGAADDVPVPRRRSGNPGYRVGAPVLAANYVAAANSTSIEIRPDDDGFKIMDTGVGGDCDTASRDGTVVAFGEDVMVGCSKLLTAEELKQLCTSSSSSYSSSSSRTTTTATSSSLTTTIINDDGTETVVPVWLRPTHAVVGVFGNADPADPGQWLRVDHDDATLAGDDDRASSSCLPTRLRYEFAWARVGDARDPQAKIVGARAVRYRDLRKDASLRPGDLRRVIFVTTVAWTRLPNVGEGDVVVPPPPALIPKLPADLFYPFELGRSSSTSWTRSATSYRRSCALLTSMVVWLTVVGLR